MIAHIKKTALLFFVLITTTKCKAQYDINKIDSNSFFGVWTVYDYKFGSAISAFDDEQAKEYLDKKIVLLVDKVIVFEDVCFTPNYSLRTEDYRNYLYSYFNETSESILSKEKVKINEISCEGKLIQNNKDSLNFIFDIIYLGQDEIMIPLNGAYFYLKKEKLEHNEIFLKELNGSGHFKQQIKLKKCVALVQLEYDFYDIPDKIIIESQDGSVLFETEMVKTTELNKESFFVDIQDNDECFLVLKVESSSGSNSQWEIKIVVSSK